MAKKTESTEQVEITGTAGEWPEGKEPQPILEALEGEPAEVTLVLDGVLFVEALKTISGGLKQLKSLFNPADSRGDAFVNQIDLLDNQIQGLVALVEPQSYEEDQA